ncbi:2OG-Fe(II) oxygenase superfamily-domain-containing protein [Ochromonadaceae sp. CCMP2298]|nr:2OG-Fe(II) oxygenase superfamily-domain-containing protein [Ochromonadaceae sp. CCMP2298]|mmetsp:Transcript_8050/g.17512  ORF Transcript_8050/g.17512 Transcript_8050/m.17512 type:complete len:356 (-) Transcript_8050:60-1127(-)
MHVVAVLLLIVLRSVQPFSIRTISSVSYISHTSHTSPTSSLHLTHTHAHSPHTYTYSRSLTNIRTHMPLSASRGIPVGKVGNEGNVGKVGNAQPPLTPEQTISLVTAAVSRNAQKILEGLAHLGWVYVDDLLGGDLCEAMRGEAVSLYEGGAFTVSKSTRWDPSTDSAVAYDKHNVFSTQLNGGQAYYEAPRLHEYVVGMTQAVGAVVMEGFPQAQLSDKLMSNKLAVCVGAGSAYDKHYDNAGLSDTRKVTVLYYMNQWRPECGGCFRIYTPSADASSSNDANINENVVDIEPMADRLLVFWSDRLVHSVLPSESPRGKEDHRYALTLWLTSTSPAAIARDDAEVRKHFGDMVV